MGSAIKNNYGYCKYCFEKDYVHIYDLYIYPKYRGQGNARIILQIAIDAIRKTGYKGAIKIVANPKANIDKDRLNAFYKSMGLDVFTYYG